MVSPNVRGIANQFDDMVEERDVRGFVGLAGLGAIGGVLAEMFHDRVAPRLQQPAEPTTSRGLLGSFLIKAGAAVLLAFLALQMDGGAAMALAVLGVGGAIDAGVDLIEAADRLRSSAPARQPRRQPRKVQRQQQSGGSSTASGNTGSRSGRSSPSRSLMNAA